MAVTKYVDSHARATQLHTDVIVQTKDAVLTSFDSIHKELDKLQSEILIKIDQIAEKQQEIMRACQPSAAALEDLEENIRKLKKMLESFAAHAGNLSHIKLTLARGASLVSSEGNLAQLVVAPSRPAPFSAATAFGSLNVPNAFAPAPTAFSAPLERRVEYRTKAETESMMEEYRPTRSVETQSLPATWVTFL